MAKSLVAITGLGVLSPIGLNIDEVQASIASTRSGIVPLEAPPLGKIYPAGVVQARFEDRFTALELPFLDRCQQMAILAADQAMRQSGHADLAEYGLRAAVHYGNVNGGVATAQAWYGQMLLEGRGASRPFTAMAIMGNAGAAQISIRRKVHGPVITHASACSSSGVAIAEAARAISDGHLDIAIAGGAEAPLTASLIGVFDGTRSLAKIDQDDPSRSCKPFSSQRNGLVVGEGAAFLILESEHNARARGAEVLAYVSGSAIGSDAWHIGTPYADGQRATLRKALDDAGLAPGEIGYVNAHATATNGGDVVESDALRSVFGSGSEAPPVSSTKGVHGHLLGATSALEAVITILALRSATLPATAHLDQIDPRCALNHIPAEAARNRRIAHALSFSCGFGGTNAALVFSSAH